MCTRLYTQYAEITFHMSRNNKGGRKSRALLVSLRTPTICHFLLTGNAAYLTKSAILPTHNISEKHYPRAQWCIIYIIYVLRLILLYYLNTFLYLFGTKSIRNIYYFVQDTDHRQASAANVPARKTQYHRTSCKLSVSPQSLAIYAHRARPLLKTILTFLIKTVFPH